MTARCAHPFTAQLGTQFICEDCGSDRTPCVTCATPGLKPKHSAPVDGHPDHCGCVRCFG